jgi:hypothetical protein
MTVGVRQSTPSMASLEPEVKEFILPENQYK